jgi:hypothetical protein
LKKIDIESKGITGLLRSFKQIIEDIDKEKEIKKIVFAGNKYTCTPFVELLTYVIRSMNKEIIYIPAIKLEEPYQVSLSDVDCNFAKGGDPYNPDVVILMGGLAMPGGPDIPSMKMFLKKIGNDNKKVIGVCFMSIFEKSKWNEDIPFDYIVDTFINNTIFRR